jgi:hypothetical protein
MSTWRFAREAPTPQEWETWKKFWVQFGLRHLQLPANLGNWCHQSPRIWPWWHNKQQDVIYHQSYHFFHAYSLLMMNHTRLGKLYFLIGETSTIPINVTPILVQHVNADVVSLQGVGRTAQHLPHFAGTFWEMLLLYGGGWMWNFIHDKTEGTGWIATALKKGTALLSTDGSYSSNKAPDLCSAGWIIACRKG